MTIPPRAVLLGALVLLSGCKLIDQTTFDPRAGTPPVVPDPVAPGIPPSPVAPGAFLRIPLDPEPEWRDAVRDGVAAARRRKPDVQFDVVAVVPAAGTAEEQAAVVEHAGGPAQRVAAAIAATGVPAARVRLLARPEPGLAAPEVRVFVR